MFSPIDRILFRGKGLTLKIYSRAELRGSDHRPVYAIFDAEMTSIDVVKRKALQDDLLKDLTSTDGAEKLGEKLARVVLQDNGELPPPSSADAAWWDSQDHPNGVFLPDHPLHLSSSTNPFDSDTASTSSSDEELYRQSFQDPSAQPSGPFRQTFASRQ